MTAQGPSHDALKGYDPSAFPTFAVTVDIVLLTVTDETLQVLLIKRGGEPFLGAWALPGGFKTPDETLGQAASRELEEETGVAAPAHLKQLGAYGDPGRDPRTNVVTIAYTAVVPVAAATSAGTDAAEAAWWPVASIQSESLALAFDHRTLVLDAVERAATDLEHTSLVSAFVGPAFTLSELQQVYEAVWGEDLDAANFRRALKAKDASTWVKGTGRRRQSPSGGGRPAEEYEFGEGWESEPPPVSRPR